MLRLAAWTLNPYVRWSLWSDLYSMLYWEPKNKTESRRPLAWLSQSTALANSDWHLQKLYTKRKRRMDIWVLPLSDVAVAAEGIVSGCGQHER